MYQFTHWAVAVPRSSRSFQGPSRQNGPRSSSLALVDALGGPAGRTLTLRRHGASRRAPPDRAPPPPARGPPDAGSPVRRAPSVVVPGRSPPTDPNPPADPGRAGSRGRPPAPSPTRRKHPPGRAGTGQGAPAPTRSRGPRLIGALPGCGHDPHPSMDSDPPPHPGRSTAARLPRPHCITTIMAAVLIIITLRHES